MRREISKGKLSRRNFTLGGFDEIPIRNSFYLYYFLFADSILHVEMLMVIVWGKFSLGLNCLNDLSVKVEPDFPPLF